MSLPFFDDPRVIAADAAFAAASAACTRADAAQIALAHRWSARAHAGQFRPDAGRTPYIAHPLRVATRVARWCPNAPTEVIAAALLHDTLEDQAEAVVRIALDEGIAVTMAEDALAARFGAKVVTLVHALTNPPYEGPPDGKNAAYRDHVVHVVIEDLHASPVKLSDLYDNALALDAVDNPAKRAKLVRKYGPVLTTLADRLAAVPQAHPLHAGRAARVAELRAALATQYA